MLCLLCMLSFALVPLLEDKQEASVGEFDEWHLCHDLVLILRVFPPTCNLFAPFFSPFCSSFLCLPFSLFSLFLFCRNQGIGRRAIHPQNPLCAGTQHCENPRRNASRTEHKQKVLCAVCALCVRARAIDMCGRAALGEPAQDSSRSRAKTGSCVRLVRALCAGAHSSSASAQYC